MLISNLTQRMPMLYMDMVKYQTTDDIVGFSIAGPRREEDYKTLFLHQNAIKVVEP